MKTAYRILFCTLGILTLFISIPIFLSLLLIELIDDLNDIIYPKAYGEEDENGLHNHS